MSVASTGGIVPLTLTVAQAAILIGCGRKTVYELINGGKLPTLTLSTASRPKIRIPRTAISAFIDAAAGTKQ